MNLFDYNLPKYKIRKPIRLIELFAGIGSQAKALENLGVNFEHYRICEFDKYAVNSYNAIHNTNFTTSDITKITAEDLGIVETDKYEYIMTYSFPCTDLSNAGLQKGMEKGSGTRSGLLWEVERLLKECKELPQILLMENVPQVHGKKNINDFNKWKDFLTSLGYSNYWQDLNAKDYEIPQNRNRCFMVSILGNYKYDFPKPKELKKHLYDMLEQSVDEKYYLSDKMLKYIVSEDDKYIVNDKNVTVNKTIACTISTREGVTRADASNYICNDLPEDYNLKTKNKRIKSLADKMDLSEDNQFMDIYNQETHKDISGTLKMGMDYQQGNIIYNNYRIRKLTPLECWRLMGFSDEDCDKASQVNCDSQLYKQAGNSIVVNVLMAIFKNLL